MATHETDYNNNDLGQQLAGWLGWLLESAIEHLAPTS
jgi:hypothetical protein